METFKNINSRLKNWLTGGPGTEFGYYYSSFRLNAEWFVRETKLLFFENKNIIHLIIIKLAQNSSFQFNRDADVPFGNKTKQKIHFI